MAQVIRLIWRLDFDVSYTYVDHIGSMVKLLAETIPDFWNEVTDGPIVRSFVGQKQTDEYVMNMTIEQNSFNGQITWVSGYPFDKVLNSEQFSATDKIVRSLLRAAEVRKLNRAGIRFSLMEKREVKAETIKSQFGMFASPAILNSVEKEFGTLRDIGLVLDGKTEDEIKFKIQVGPFAKHNVKLTAPHLTEDQIKAFNDYDLFMDGDFFEEHISFEEQSLFRWAGTKRERAAQFVKLVQTIKS